MERRQTQKRNAVVFECRGKRICNYPKVDLYIYVDENTTQLGAVLSIRVASCYGQSHYVLFALAQNLRVMPKYKWVYNQRLMKRRPTVANQPSAASQPPFFSLSSPLHRDYKSNAQ